MPSYVKLGGKRPSAAHTEFSGNYNKAGTRSHLISFPTLKIRQLHEVLEVLMPSVLTITRSTLQLDHRRSLDQGGCYLKYMIEKDRVKVIIGL